MRQIENLPKACRECAELMTCQFPELMEYLMELVDRKFHGSVTIPFKNGTVGKVKKEELLDFIRL